MKYIPLFILCLGIFIIPSFVHGDTSSTTLSLRIETATSTLWNENITIAPCSPEETGTATSSAYCVINATGLPTTWSSFGTDYFLDSIGGKSNDTVSGTYWLWFSDDVYGQTALTSHIVSSNEHLLLTLGIMPLKLVLGTSTITVFEFGFDSSWNGVWQESASSTVYVGSETLCTTPTNGSCDIQATTSALTVYATKPYFATSSSQTLSPLAIPIESGLGGSHQNVVLIKKVSKEQALSFLSSKQQSDGSFSNVLYTDWAALALASDRENDTAQRLTAFLTSYTPSLSSATDYERHAMALMALGINPYTGTNINYIEHIVHLFDGEQIGDRGLVNDDIFALFPLIKAGYSEQDDVVYNTVLFILKNQKENGSWNESIDMTAAAIQALSQTKTIPGVVDSLQRAKTYILGKQESDGGFGSVFSTAWVIQSIISLDESVSYWKNSLGKDPFDSLSLVQGDTGGFEMNSSEGTQLWATAYAIPALFERTWPSLLSSFSKPVIIQPTVTTETQPLPIDIATTTPLPVPVQIPIVPQEEKIVIEPEVRKENIVEIQKESNPITSLASVYASNPIPPNKNIPLNTALGVIALSGISFLFIKP